MPAFGANGPTVALSPTTTSSSTTITAETNTFRVVNLSGVTCFVRTGTGTTTAVTTDMPVPAGNTEVFSKPASHNVVAVIAASAGTASSFFVTPGMGE